MKIDKYAKQAIVKAIMADVPKVDKVKRKEERQAAIVKVMSPAVRKVYKAAPNALRTHCVGDVIYAERWDARYVIVGDVDSKVIDSLVAPYEAEDQVMRDAQAALRGAIEACNTLKQLNDRFPEFKKYFPTAQTATANLPALANVVANLSKLGWPKGESK